MMSDKEWELYHSIEDDIREKHDAVQLFQKINDLNLDNIFRRSNEFEKSDPENDLCPFRGQFLCIAIENDHKDLITLLLVDVKYDVLLAKFPYLIFTAMDADNIELVDIFLRVGVPESWLNDPEFSPVSDTLMAHYRSAIRCACYLDRPDILKRLVWSYQAWER